jgi:hypothetical protein
MRRRHLKVLFEDLSMWRNKRILSILQQHTILSKTGERRGAGALSLISFQELQLLSTHVYFFPYKAMDEYGRQDVWTPKLTQDFFPYHAVQHRTGKFFTRHARSKIQAALT